MFGASPFHVVCAFPLAFALTATACGSTAAPKDAGPPPLEGGPYHPSAPCEVTIDSPTLPPVEHVAEGSVVVYTSNPPAGGPHYGRWARFEAYTTPVPRPYWVHDLEHGAVTLLYRCDADAGSACEADAQSFLAKAVAALPTDPACAPSVRVRTVTTPDPLIPTPFAAAAWGWTYTAACADLPTLTDFVKAHYAHAPEDECVNGTYPP